MLLDGVIFLKIHIVFVYNVISVVTITFLKHNFMFIVSACKSKANKNIILYSPPVLAESCLSPGLSPRTPGVAAGPMEWWDMA
jgi:hypothetical protein